MIKIRCDDTFVDTDADVVDRIWYGIHRRGFKHIIGVTPIGEGEPIYHEKPLKKGNQWIDNATGDRCISENRKLLFIILRYHNLGAEIALHGYKHLDYTQLNYYEQLEHLGNGKLLLEKTLNIPIRLFIPPFNKYNQDTIDVCKILDLEITPPYYEADTKVITNHPSEKKLMKATKETKEHGNCAYHPYWIEGNWGYATWNLNKGIMLWEEFLDLVKNIG